MFGKKRDSFDWVTSEDSRMVIAKDYLEAKGCYDRGYYKACQVMLGSVIEEVLSYALVRSRIDFPKNSSLYDLIRLAETHSILQRGDAYLGQAIRDFRNLVHPGKEKREKKRPNFDSATLAWQASKCIISEVKKHLEFYAPVSMDASLLIQGKVVSLYKFPFTLGRAKDNDFVFNDTSVSAYHACIDFKKNRFFIQRLEEHKWDFCFCE